MKWFRVVYWLGSMITERFVKAEDEQQARKIFEDNDLIVVRVCELED